MFTDKNSKIERQLLEADVEIEQKEEIITELKHLLSRLSLTANNLTPELDIALEELRQQIKNQSPITVISHCIEKISQEMLTLDSQPTEKANSTHQTFLNNVSKELSELNLLNKEDCESLRALMSNSSNSEDYLLSRFIEIIRNSLTQYAQSVTKLLPSDRAMAPIAHDANTVESLNEDHLNNPILPAEEIKPPTYCQKKFNESLSSLLNTISAPEKLQLTKDKIIVKLQEKICLHDVTPLVTDISSLIISTYYDEQKQFSNFIEGLNKRFLDVNTYLINSLESNGQLETNHLTLKESVENSLNKMQLHYKKTTDLTDIMLQLDKGFNEIRSNIKQFHDLEVNKQKDSKCKIKELQQSLTTTQKIALELQQSLKIVSEKSQKDSLTGLFNRETYEEKLNNVLTRVKLLDQTAVIAVVDIDLFKIVNDTYGHLAGDSILRSIAQILQQNMRKTDFVARYGGEEFVIILDQADIDSASTILGKIREQVEVNSFLIKDRKINITISIGYTLITNGDNKNNAFARADSALYQAKEAGRNQIEYL